MATKLGNNQTVFRGVQQFRLLPRKPAASSDVGEYDSTHDGILQDQAIVRQYMTGKQLDDSTAWSGTPQAHDGTTGCALGWPLSAWWLASGGSGASDETNVPGAKIFLGNLADGKTDEVALFRWPVFVPTGTDTVVVVVRGDPLIGTRDLRLRVFNTSFVQQSVSTMDPDLRRDGTIFFTVPVTGGAVNVLSLDINVTGYSSLSPYEPMLVSSGEVLPLYWRRAPLQNPPSATDLPSNSASSSAVVSSSFTPVWDTLGEDTHLTSWVAHAIAANDAFLHESITGQALPNKAAATATAHDHDGSNSPTIDLPLLSQCCGWVPVDDVGIDDDPASASPEGFGGRGFALDSGHSATTWYTGRYYTLQAPTRSGSPSLNWSALVYNSHATNDGDVRISISTDGSTWTNATAQAVNTNNGWNYATGTVAFSSGTRYWLRLQLYSDAAPSAPVLTCTGLCVWVT